MSKNIPSARHQPTHCSWLCLQKTGLEATAPKREKNILEETNGEIGWNVSWLLVMFLNPLLILMLTMIECVILLRSLPSELGDLVNLRELMLNNNYLRSLPYELGKLFQLQVGRGSHDLSQNKFNWMGREWFLWPLESLWVWQLWTLVLLRWMWGRDGKFPAPVKMKGGDSAYSTALPDSFCKWRFLYVY